MDLNEMRKRMDEINRGLLDLFLQRMALSEQVAQYKAQNGLPIESRDRERAILTWAAQEAGQYEPYAYRFFTTLFELSKARQRELTDAPSRVREKIERGLAASEAVFPRTGTVACQGVEGANSQAACDALIPRGSILYVKTFEAVFDAVESGLCRFGVVPVENSLGGSVRGVYELLQRKHFSIVRSIKLPIRHTLMAKPGARLEQIREIYSHEQAISQCARFLSGLGKNVNVIPMANTAMAAKMVRESERTDVAAICAPACAQLYGLEPLREDIQDSSRNETTFICIAREPVIYEGADRISLILACENKPGALEGILSKFSAHGVNLRKLESCPVAGSGYEFIFLMELEASVREPGVLPMLEDLERSCPLFLFLGCYTQV